MTITVIIPALNEAERIEATLGSVRAQTGPFEVIVADGGSTDGTPEKAAPHAHVIGTPSGRSLQMNVAAALARGQVLLFLHADTLLPPSAFEAIREEMKDPDVTAGCFRLAFDSSEPIYRFYGFCTRLRWRRLCFGDRAFFIRKSAFEDLGGFPAQPLFEDLQLALTAQQLGRWAYLSLPVVTASRRFEQHGSVRQQMRNVGLWLLYNMGVSADRLARYYR